MGAKLYEEKYDNVKEMCDLEYGEVAVVINTGELVMPFNDSTFYKTFVVIGGVRGSTHKAYSRICDYTVRVLQPGELIEIT